jgi:hypothetical protein
LSSGDLSDFAPALLRFASTVSAKDLVRQDLSPMSSSWFSDSVLVGFFTVVFLTALALIFGDKVFMGGTIGLAATCTRPHLGRGFCHCSLALCSRRGHGSGIIAELSPLRIPICSSCSGQRVMLRDQTNVDVSKSERAGTAEGGRAIRRCVWEKITLSTLRAGMREGKLRHSVLGTENVSITRSEHDS